MPSALHEALLLLFRNQPTLAVGLLRDPLGVELPAFTEATIESGELSQIVPPGFQVDLVLLLRHGRPVLAIVVEVQLRRDDDKRFTWPLYAASIRARHRCDVTLLVVAPDPAVAAWCQTPIVMGHAGWVLNPHVLSRAAVPVVTDETDARNDPELAVLSAIAHAGTAQAADVALAALGAAAPLDEERAKLYADLVLQALPQAARRMLEALMEARKYEYQSDFAKKYLNQGIAEGTATGKAEGKAEGQAQGKAEALELFLTSRGIVIDADALMKIRACRDLGQLDAWLRRAGVATTVADLFDAT